MKITIQKGYSKDTYRLVSFDFDNEKEIMNVFNPSRTNVKEDIEHLRVDVTTDIGTQVSYGCFLDIDNTQCPEVLTYNEVCDRFKLMGINFIGYKTYNSGKDGKDRFRMFVPFSNTCQASLHKHTVLRLSDELFLTENIDSASLEYRHVMFAPAFAYNKDKLFVDLIIYKEGDYFTPVTVSDFTEEEKKDIINSSPTKKWELQKGSLIHSYVSNVSIEEAISKYCPDIYIKSDNSERYRYFESKSAPGAVIYKGSSEAPGRLFSWHRKDPYSLQFMNSFDILLYFGCKGNKKMAMEEAMKVYQISFLSSPSAEVAFQNMHKGTGMWFFYSMLKNKPDMLYDIKEDTFGKKISIKKGSRLLSLTGDYGDKETCDDYEELNDRHIIFIKSYLSNYGRKFVSKEIVNDFMAFFCRENSFDSLRNHLEEISSDKWDGVERAKHIFELLGADNSPYNNSVALIMFAGLWYRGMFYKNQEVKFDYVVILEGKQGIGKSSLLKFLCVDPELFSDETSNLGTRNTKMQLSRKWIAELGELRAFYSRTMNVMDLKGYISQTKDSFRPPYGTMSIDIARRYIFIGTTNRNEGYLKDLTGNRRFLPIECKKLERDDFVNNQSRINERIHFARQIWGEVKHLYETGQLKQYMILPKELELEAEAIQAKKEQAPLSESRIMDYLGRDIPKNFETFKLKDIYNYEMWQNMGLDGLKQREYVCIEEVLDALYKDTISSKVIHANKLEIAKVLTAHGWTRGSDIGRVQVRNYACYMKKNVYYNPYYREV